MTGLQALIFDVDGTLANTERDGHRVAFNRAFADAGLDWDWTVELYAELLSVTGGKERILYYLDKYKPGFARPDDPSGFIGDLHRDKTGHYTALVAEGAIPLRPGVYRLLEEARAAGVRLAIATTTTPENVEALIGSTLPKGAMDWFEVVGAGDIVPEKKPAADIYTWVLDQMQLDGGCVVAFEDSAHGVAAARGAGIEQVVVTVNDYTQAQDFSAARSVLTDLGEPGKPASPLSGKAPPDGVVDLVFLRGLVEGEKETP